MQNTTPATLESIASENLVHISGGCHKNCGPVPANQIQQVQILQLPQMPGSQLPAASAGDQVSTNVSFNGQPVASA